MSKILYDALRIVRNQIYKVSYYHADVFLQKLKLRLIPQKPTIINTAVTDQAKTFETVCIFIFYEPDGRISPSNQRILKALKKNGVSTLIVTNHSLSEEQTLFFNDHAFAVIERNNLGFDFGAYKDAIHWLVAEQIDFQRLVFLNDSVFYVEAGLDEFVKKIAGTTPGTQGIDAIAAYENWAEGYHMQSFALSISAKVFKSQIFQAFWDKYLPISNRVYAIEKGEKKLSQAILKAADTSLVLYGVQTLREKLFEQENTDIQTIYLPMHLRFPLQNYPLKLKYKRKAIQKIVECVNSTSPIHSGAFYIPKYLNSPLYKKDLVFRQRFHFWEIQDWCAELMTDAEAAEFLQILRKKGDWTQLTRSELRKYRIGVK